MIYAIGMPGAAVRLYLDTDEVDRALRQCGAGEVAIGVEARERWAVVAADGLSVASQAPPPTWLADELRARRTALLSRCDWTVVPDSPLSETQQAEWRAYRQLLRDLPADQLGVTPETVVWPQEPAL